ATGWSTCEGPNVRWIKKVGASVERDEPLFEISTVKVDAEIPSPAAGVITEIRATEGQTVEVNSVVAVIGEAGAKPAAAAPKAVESPKPNPPVVAAHTTVVPQPTAPPAPAHLEAARPVTSAPSEEAPADKSVRSSPLVRRIAKEHNVDINQIHGTGISGRVTKDDILAFIGGAPQPAAPVAPQATAAPTSVEQAPPTPAAPRPAPS